MGCFAGCAVGLCWGVERLLRVAAGAVGARAGMWDWIAAAELHRRQATPARQLILPCAPKHQRKSIKPAAPSQVPLQPAIPGRCRDAMCVLQQLAALQFNAMLRFYVMLRCCATPHLVDNA